MACCIQIEKFMKRIETEIGQIGQTKYIYEFFQTESTKKNFGSAIYLPVAEVKKMNYESHRIIKDHKSTFQCNIIQTHI